MEPSNTVASAQQEMEDPDVAVLTSPIESSATATTTRHRRTASDIKPTSAAARRMSQRSTPQSELNRGRLPVEYPWSGVLRTAKKRPLVSVAIGLSGLVLTGTAYSSFYDLALNTSVQFDPLRTAYFAQKSNPFNQYGVKLAWLHTTIFYFFHLLSSPTLTSISSLLIPLWTYILATTFWGVFTTWFFGHGIGDRIIEISGGQCVIPLPTNWGLDREKVGEMMNIIPSSTIGIRLLESTLDSTTASVADTSNSMPADDNLYLGVPSDLCTGTRRQLSPKSNPDIFAILSNLPFPSSTFQKEDKPVLAIPRPRWYRGHDISGHTFILVLSTILITRRLIPTLRRWATAQETKTGGGASLVFGKNERMRQLVHVLATVLGTMLLGLWAWMTLMTAIYFHNPQEKISGLVLGLIAAYLVDTFTPTSAATFTPPVTMAIAFPSSSPSSLPQSVTTSSDTATCQQCNQPLLLDPSIQNLTSAQYTSIASSFASGSTAHTYTHQGLDGLPPTSKAGAEIWAKANPNVDPRGGKGKEQ